MKARLGLVLATAALISGAGCAAGSGGGAGPAAPSALPGAEVLPEGVRPRDNNHTKSADLYLTQAQTAADETQKTQHFQQALQAAMDGITADPENPKSYFQAAQAYVGLKDYLGADSMFTKAEELHPRYIIETEPWREQGWVNAYNDAIVPLNAGELEQAAELFEAANKLYSKRPEAFLQLGSLYSRLNDPNKAADAFQKAMEILEETKEVQMMDTANAATWEQHWEIATMGLGQALRIAERYQEAADLFGRLLQDDPENPELIGSLAGVLTELGQADSVEVLYNKLFSNPNLTERDFFNAGVGLYQIEQYDKAEEAFRRAAELNPFNRDARFNLAQTYYAAEDWEGLVPAARDLLEVDPLNGLVWIFLARAHSELGQTEQANEVFQQYQAIGYELENLMLDVKPEGGAHIRGQLKNTAAEPGTTVTLRFHFGGPNHEEIGTLDIRVQTPEVDSYADFQGEFNSTEAVTGYRYEVIR